MENLYWTWSEGICRHRTNPYTLWTDFADSDFGIDIFANQMEKVEKIV